MLWEKETCFGDIDRMPQEGAAGIQVGKFKRQGGCHPERFRARVAFGLLDGILKKEVGVLAEARRKQNL